MLGRPAMGSHPPSTPLSGPVNGRSLRVESPTGEQSWGAFSCVEGFVATPNEFLQKRMILLPETVDG
ncbi:uncharacterized protein N7511_011049 [Penicillium nucicola]|uniref:uncharacterized protein n=1 Tax=Penicillium nucicola TaxID=1850975 RepID=UPI0025457CA2|nr:uncharacterized protein N7511_011049 [Penicillium nucicola]KAJ5749353.1 hypothetical protein N7511_011049 [Penicillium nucicola]